MLDYKLVLQYVKTNTPVFARHGGGETSLVGGEVALAECRHGTITTVCANTNDSDNSSGSLLALSQKHSP